MPTITEISESDAQTSYPVSDILWTGKTAACDSVIFAESKVYGRMLFLDGELQSASSDERIYHESLVHPVLVATRDIPNKRVLVIGGGEGATVREVLRWGPFAVANVVWVDIDTELVDLCKEHLDWAPHVYDNPRVQFIGDDIQKVLPTLGQFDVIILDLPDPDGATGYLYSVSFWKDLQMHLGPNGRLVSHVGPVHPSGNIGEGVQRIWTGVKSAGLDPWVSGFYSVPIPSFQGSWGFWISGDQPFASMNNREIVQLPSSLHVVDVEQLCQWARPPLMWRSALNYQVVAGVAVGVCSQYTAQRIPYCYCREEEAD
jgi:spermidine synthase